MEIPPGTLIFEDPPIHNIHRNLLSRMFTPRKVHRAGTEDPRVHRPVPRPAGRHRPVRLRQRPRRADADAGDRDAARHPRRATRSRVADHGGGDPAEPSRSTLLATGEVFAEFIDWRAEHPSDDIMTDLLNVEFEDETGTVRRLRRDELLIYLNVVATRGQRDHDPADRLGRQDAGRAPRPASRAGRRTRP